MIGIIEAININSVKILLTVWPSGLRRWLQAPVRKGVGSNPTAVIINTAITPWQHSCAYCMSKRTLRRASSIPGQMGDESVCAQCDTQRLQLQPCEMFPRRLELTTLKVGCYKFY